MLSHESQQSLNAFASAHRLTYDNLEMSSGLFAQRFIRQGNTGKSHNGVKGVIYLVPDARNQLPDGGHFFRVENLIAQTLICGDVGQHDDDAAYVSLFI